MEKKEIDYSNKRFREALKDLFKVTGLSQAEIARRMDLHEARISQILRQKMVSLETMEHLAKAFEISPSYFLEYRIHKAEEAMKKNPKLLERLADVIQW